MKKSIALAALSAVSLLALVPGTAPAEQDGKTTVAEYCASRGDLGLTHGACVAYFETRNVVPHDASVCQDADTQRRLGVSNHGQCVKKLAELRK